MPAGRFTPRALRFENGGAATGASGGTQLAGSGSTNTLSAWTQIIASTAFNAGGFYIHMGDSGSAQLLLDVGIGSAGNEVVLVPQIQYHRRLAGQSQSVFCPVSVPAGSRISVRHQSIVGSLNIDISIDMISDGGLSFQRATCYGAVTGSSRGTSVDPGGSANTKGSWTQLVASTGNPMYWAILSFGNVNNTAMTTAQFLFDIGIGGSGSEVVLIPNILVRSNLGRNEVNPMFRSFPMNVPAGTRLSARSQCSITDATDRVLDLSIIGFD